MSKLNAVALAIGLHGSDTMNQQQLQKCIDLHAKGAEQDENVPNIMWWLGHCFKVQEDGSIDEL
jgi:hypothetical protein